MAVFHHPSNIWIKFEYWIALQKFPMMGLWQPNTRIVCSGRLLKRPYWADLMWSDPDSEKTGFVISPRGAGYVFGHDVVWKFLHLNDLVHIVRAHQLCMCGYQVLFDDNLSTVWSAPNYCYRSLLVVSNHAVM